MRISNHSYDFQTSWSARKPKTVAVIFFIPVIVITGITARTIITGQKSQDNIESQIGLLNFRKPTEPKKRSCDCHQECASFDGVEDGAEQRVNFYFNDKNHRWSDEVNEWTLTKTVITVTGYASFSLQYASVCFKITHLAVDDFDHGYNSHRHKKPCLIQFRESSKVAVTGIGTV